MPVITVETWEGRTVEQKRRLAAAITEAMVEHFQSNPERTYVLIYDIPKQNWARAGILSSDEEAAEQQAK